jgi:predicted outer membrane repeat protein
MNGGGIKAANGLTIETSLIDDNRATIGGGVHADAIVTMSDTTVSFNEATVMAAGIYLQNSNSTLSQVTVSSNQTDGAGGGIYTTQPFTIRHSTNANNRA